MGGSSIQVMSVCQPSASGGLSAVSVMYPSVLPLPTNRSTSGKRAGSPKQRCQGEVLVVGERLVAEEQHAVAEQRAVDRSDVGV